MLDDLCGILSNMGKYLSKLYSDIFDLRDDLQQQSLRIFDEQFHYNIVETMVSVIESEHDKIQWNNLKVREQLLEM